MAIEDANGCRPLRGLVGFALSIPGVSLRFTPGFMLSPRSAGFQSGEAVIAVALNIRPDDSAAARFAGFHYFP
jgi:hypothetical protein